MDYFFIIILFILAIYFVVKGGGLLVSSAINVSCIFNISQVVIGATLVSIATTLPEVLVSIFAVAKGNNGIAVGNAVGSMICNVALVLGLSITFLPQKVSRRAVMGKSVFLIFVNVILFFYASNLNINIIESLTLVMIFIVFMFVNVKEAISQSKSEKNKQLDTGLIYSNKAQKKALVTKTLLLFLVGEVFVIVGAWMLVTYGERLALIFNIDQTLVGLTFIAVGTSLPELVTAIASIKRRSGGLAFGNVVGANILNCTLLMGSCGTFAGSDGLGVSLQTLFISLPVLMILTIIAVLPVLKRQKTFKAQGIFLLVVYLLYIAYLVYAQVV